MPSAKVLINNISRLELGKCESVLVCQLVRQIEDCHTERE